MKCFKKLLTLLLVTTVGLHYCYCGHNINEVSNNAVIECPQLPQFCHYTSLTIWDDLLMKNSKYYKNIINPLITENYKTVLYPNYLNLREKVVLYYNIYLSEHINNMNNNIQKLIKKNEHIQTLNAELFQYYNNYKHKLYGLFLWSNNFYDLMKNELQNYLTLIIENLRMVYYFILEQYRQYELTKKEKLNSKMSSPVPTPVAEFTSQVVDIPETTSILNKKINVVNEKTNLVSKEEETHEDVPVEVSDWEMAQDEFKAWYNTVDSKSANVFKLLDKEIETFLKERIKIWEPSLTPMIDNFQEEISSHFSKLLQTIEDIECTSDIDPETNQVIYFDKNGETQLPEFVTGQLVSNLFRDVESQFQALENEINTNLISNVDTIDEDLKMIHDQHVEIYEEWGDVMITEWSKRMAFIDIVAMHMDTKEGEQDHSQQYWKDFLKLKKQVIKTRDTLVNYPIKLTVINEFLADIQKELGKLRKESNEYMLILRAKSSLLFEKREKREAEILEEQIKLQREETDRIEGEKQKRTENLQFEEQQESARIEREEQERQQEQHRQQRKQMEQDEQEHQSMKE